MLRTVTLGKELAKGRGGRARGERVAAAYSCLSALLRLGRGLKAAGTIWPKERKQGPFQYFERNFRRLTLHLYR